MHREIAVRRFRPGDLGRVLRIESASFGADAYDRELFLELFERCGPTFLVALRAGEVVGYMVTCIRKENAELVSVAVAPSARSKGVGTALMRSALRRLRPRGVERFRLKVKVTNHAAIAFYEGFGFRRGRRAHGYYEDGEDAWDMLATIAQ